uniref:Uncharacterized protein n=1 Tax=Romanomermis culicivorax TaxID=13658 RepID=A0A915K7S3_ROMCU
MAIISTEELIKNNVQKSATGDDRTMSATAKIMNDLSMEILKQKLIGITFTSSLLAMALARHPACSLKAFSIILAAFLSSVVPT